MARPPEPPHSPSPYDVVVVVVNVAFLNQGTTRPRLRWTGSIWAAAVNDLIPKKSITTRFSVYTLSPSLCLVLVELSRATTVWGGGNLELFIRNIIAGMYVNNEWRALRNGSGSGWWWRTFGWSPHNCDLLLLLYRWWGWWIDGSDDGHVLLLLNGKRWWWPRILVSSAKLYGIGRGIVTILGMFFGELNEIDKRNVCGELLSAICNDYWRTPGGWQITDGKKEQKHK